jgi:hypothetical protein
MRAFIFASIGAIAIAIAVLGAFVLGSIQETADQAFRLCGSVNRAVADVCFWPLADIASAPPDVRFRE